MVGNALRNTHELLSPAVRQAKSDEEAREKVFKERRASDLRWLMSQPAGRRIVAKQMAEGRLLDKATTPEQAAVRNHLVEFAGELIALDHKQWLLMLDEAHIDARNARNAS